MQIENLAPSLLKPYPGNPRRNEMAVDKVAASIREFGFRQPIVVDENMVVVVGHTRLLAAQSLGLETVPVHIARGLSPAKVRAYRLADNRTNEEAEWDLEKLRAELEGLRSDGIDLSATGFDEDEIAQALAGGGIRLTDPDAVPEAGARAVATLCDVWLLGGHRLVCGDSTKSEDVARVMNGERAALLFTSPPYGNQRDYTTGGIGDWDALMQGVFGRLSDAMADDGQVLVNLGLVHRDNEWRPYWQDWLDWMRGHGWRRFGFYIWDQGPGLPGDWNGRLAPAFEFLFHFNRASRKPNKIVPCKWAGHINDSHGGMRDKDGSVGEWAHAGQGVQETRIPDNVIRITRHKARGIETEHPAVFPVALPEFIMNAYSDTNDIVLEPFAGSGTTLIAGERAGRRVRAIELAPAYVDVAIKRWQDFTGKKATLEETGQTFEDVADARYDFRKDGYESWELWCASKRVELQDAE